MLRRNFSRISEIVLILGLIYIVVQSLSKFDDETYEEEKKIMYLLGAGTTILATSSSREIVYSRKTRGNRQGLEYSAVLLPCVMASRMVYVRERGRDDRFERGSYWAAVCASAITSLNFVFEARGQSSVQKLVKQISIFVYVGYLCVYNVIREM